MRERRCRREAAVDAALDEVERAHDLRVMRSDRGFWCLPEADIGIPFTPARSAVQARPAPQTAHVAMTTARKAGATLGTIKARMYAPVLDLWRNPTAPRG